MHSLSQRRNLSFLLVLGNILSTEGNKINKTTKPCIQTNVLYLKHFLSNLIISNFIILDLTTDVCLGKRISVRYIHITFCVLVLIALDQLYNARASSLSHYARSCLYQRFGPLTFSNLNVPSLVKTSWNRWMQPLNSSKQ